MGRKSILRIWRFQFQSLRRWGLWACSRNCSWFAARGLGALQMSIVVRAFFDGGVLTIKTISSREVYRNAWTSVREDVIERSNGERGIYGVIDKDPATIVIPLDVGPDGEL